jgi:hypothetical protein
MDFFLSVMDDWDIASRNNRILDFGDRDPQPQDFGSLLSICAAAASFSLEKKLNVVKFPSLHWNIC